MEIVKLEKRHVDMLSDIRNLSVEYLHDKNTFNREETNTWFETTNPPFWAIEVNGDMIGYIRTSNWVHDSCFIGMDLHPDYRNNGYGQAAYKKFLSMLRAQNVYEVHLIVLTANERAIHIYNKLGFEKSGDHYSPDTGDSIYMTLEL